ncbi:MAG TPA: cupredoxin domain-containing protein [Acetobacteraceae bacterium]|jgi:plastocyanin|nr:cupredoxin domain-containing protein [Acetobacteraceae bacterium]
MRTHLTRRGVVAATAAGLGLALITVRAKAAANASVTIDNFTFSPQTLTVAAGTKVTFTNQDDIPHTITSDASPPLFKSPPLDTDDTFAFTFATPGTYAYFCSLHPHMQGSVIVQ